MKIAIVTGGFKGIQQQWRRWNLEQQVETMQQEIVNRERGLLGARTKLAKLIAERDATPTFEKVAK